MIVDKCDRFDYTENRKGVEYMSELKEDWKIVGKEALATLEDTGRVLLRSLQVGAQKLDAWLNEEVGNK